MVLDICSTLCTSAETRNAVSLTLGGGGGGGGLTHLETCVVRMDC